MKITKNYENQMISVDISLFSIINNKLKILLVLRNEQPFLNKWSLVGGKVYNNETCENAVIRELKEKIGTDYALVPNLCGVFSSPDRDPRFRNISISYFCLVNPENLDGNINNLKIKDAKWFEIDNVENLAFDHNEILNNSLKILKSKVYDIEFMKNYLPETFTLVDLQTIYESILNTSLDKRNFRRKLLSLDCLESTGLKNEKDTHKKSEIYKFK